MTGAALHVLHFPGTCMAHQMLSMVSKYLFTVFVGHKEAAWLIQQHLVQLGDHSDITADAQTIFDFMHDGLQCCSPSDMQKHNTE